MALTAGFSIAWLSLTLGPWALDPTNVDWLMNGDVAQHYLGWAFFRQAPWGWPLGQASNLARPLGASVMMTDSLPWAALLFKPFSELLPDNFQYVGPAVGLAFVLQGQVGAWFARRLGLSAIEQALTGMLMVLAPPLAARLGHDTLCAHWLLLAGLTLPLLTPARRVPAALGLSALAAATHPYLAAMLLPLLAATLAAQAWERALSWRTAALTLAGCLGLTLVEWWALGAFSAGATGAGGFGDFSANVNTLVNAMGRSRFVPELDFEPDQREGYGYLGLGGIALVVLAAVLLARRRVPNFDVRRWGVPALACLTLAFFATATPIRLGHITIATAENVYRHLQGLTAAFRSSGRFIWPLHYGLLLGAVATLARWQAPLLRAGVLLVAVGLQVAEAKLPWASTPPHAAPVTLLPGLEGVHHLVMYPNSLAEFPPCLEGVHYERSSWARPAQLASRNHLSFSGGQLARLDASKVDQTCFALAAPVHEHRLPDDTLYVVAPERLHDFDHQATCGQVDGLLLCATERPGALHEFLRAHALPGDDQAPAP
jgi:hypothetical protein